MPNILKNKNYLFMKSLIKRKGYILIFSTFFLFFNCQEINDGDFVEPITTYEKIKGTWSLSSLVLRDDYAKSLDIELSEVNLTNMFNFSDLKIVFNVDSNNKPVDFAIIGDFPRLFPTSGYWDLNSAFPSTNQEPALFNLYSDLAKTTKIGELNLTAVPSENSNMEIRLIRYSNDIAFATYIFKFFPSK